MNATQLKYARSRADAIYRSRQQAVRDKFREATVTLTMSQRLKALRDGYFTVNLKHKGHYLHDAIRFDAEVPHDTKGEQAAMTKLTTEYQKLTDELVLGDNEQALALLEAFAKA